MRTILFVLVSFIAVTATLSGLLMMSDPGGSVMSLPPGLLEATPFKNYLIPGILLTAIVGGVNLLAVFYNLQRSPNRYNWAMAGGVLISGWIVVQIILINTFHWLHVIYFIVGLAIVLIAYQLKGKWVV
jgi:hypothetical protein